MVSRTLTALCALSLIMLFTASLVHADDFDDLSSSSEGWEVSSSSAPDSMLSSSSEILISSSSGESDLSSSSVVLISSSSAAGDLSSSSVVLVSSSSSESSSSSAVLVSSSSSSSAESASSSSSTENVDKSSSSSSTGSSSSSPSTKSSSSSTASSSSSSSSSSGPVVSPVQVPAGTVSLSFTIDLPEGGINDAIIGALTSDIADNIANGTGKTREQIKPFIVLSVGTNTVSRRRLLNTITTISFMILGNITTVTGNTSALAAATSISQALASGSFVSTESQSFGVAVPIQQVAPPVEVINPPDSSSSSGGGDSEDSSSSSSSSSGEGGVEPDSGSSSLSDGAIAGAVVGSVVGAILIVAVLVLAVRTGFFTNRFTPEQDHRAVAQANANDVRGKGPLPIKSFEDDVEVGNAGVVDVDTVRVHDDSPAAPADQPKERGSVSGVQTYGVTHDNADVQVTFESRE